MKALVMSCTVLPQEISSFSKKKNCFSALGTTTFQVRDRWVLCILFGTRIYWLGRDARVVEFY